jgi:microcystin-dependent protein
LFDLNNFDTAGNGHGAGNSAPGPYILGTGTWTKPAGVQRIEVWVVGGGGSNSSNSQSGSTASCPGGGGGGCAYGVFDVTNITSATYEIGMGGKAWLIGATTNNSAGPSEFIIGGVTMTATGGGQSTSGTTAVGGLATGGNMLNESGIGGGTAGNLTGQRGFNSLAPLKRLGLGATPCAAGGSNGGNAGGIFIKEYSDASAHLVGEKLVATQLITTAGAGTWTKPAGVSKIEVWCVGGGGTGASGGGGGTAYLLLDVSAIASIAYVVGATDVSSTFAHASPGLIGQRGTNGAGGGTGGSASNGTHNFIGSDGSDGGHAALDFAQYGKGANTATAGATGCIMIKEYSDASLVSGGSLVPTGVLNPYAGATAPAGWLLCFGQAISRTVYSTLFTAISTTYGVGDGSTTFALPDMRGRAVAGQDDMGGTSADRVTTALADALGGVFGTETVAHTHGVGGSPPPAGFQDGGTDQQVSTTTTSVIQPTIFLNYIIKT